MNKKFIKKNKLFICIIIYLLIIIIIHRIKPAIFYNKDGSIKHFGIGYKKKTIIPIWIISIIVAILVYTLVIFYIQF